MSIASQKRILTSLTNRTIDEIWKGLIAQKGNELTILNDERGYLNEEITNLKSELRAQQITIPDASSTSGFEEGSSIPFGSVANNLRETEKMITYKRGELEALEKALNQYGQGRKLMETMGSQYSALDTVDMYDQDESFQRFQVGGDIDDTTSEMGQLYASLSDEEKALWGESPQFREGFQSLNTREIALKKNIDYLQTEQLSNQILNEKEENVLSNINKYQEILEERSFKLTSDLKAQIKIGGMSPQMINLALTAGDTEQFNKYMEQINTNQNYSLIHDEIGTMLQAYNADNPYPVLNTLGNIYEEFENRLAMEDRWLTDMPPTMGADGVTPVGPAIDLIRNAKKGRFKGMDPAVEKDAREYHRLYKRYEQFIGSGLMPNEDDLKHALTLNNTAEFLTNTEVNFLSNASGKNIDTYYREGLPIDEEDLALMLEGKYEPGYEESTIDEIMLAHSEWIDLQGAGGDDNLGTVELNDLIESQNAIYADKDADKLANRNLVTAQQNLSRYYQGFYGHNWVKLPSVIASGQAHRGHPGGDVAYFAKDEKLLLEDIATMEAEVKRQASRYVSKPGYGFLGLTGSGGNQETAVKLLQAWDEYKEALLSNFERVSLKSGRRTDISEDVLRYLDPSSVPKQTRGTGARGALTPEEWDELQRSLQQP